MKLPSGILESRFFVCFHDNKNQTDFDDLRTVPTN